MIDLTPLLQAVIALLAVVISRYAIPYIKTKTGTEKFERMRAWVEIGVRAAEQIYNGPGEGERKKQYVLKFLQDHGYTVDLAELEALLECAVKDMNTEQGYIEEAY